MASRRLGERGILDELRQRVADAAVPTHAHVELGQFVEMLAEAFGDAVSEGKQVHVSHWHTRLEDVHAATYSALATAYANRNIASHPNAAQEILTPESVAADLAGIERLLPIAIGHVRDSCDADLLGHLGDVIIRRGWSSLAAGEAATEQKDESGRVWASLRMLAAGMLVAVAGGLGGWLLLRSPVLPTAAQVVSEWRVGDKWVYESVYEAAADHPDEHLQRLIYTQRELKKIVPTKVGVQLHFMITAGEEKEERPALWRVEADHIESMNPKKMTSRESVYKSEARSSAEELVFETLKSTWEVRLVPGVGPTLLAWSNSKRQFRIARRLKYARIGGRDWGDRAIRPLLCDWRESDKKPNSRYALASGMFCSTVQMVDRQASLTCGDDAHRHPLASPSARIKLFSVPGAEWVVSVSRKRDHVEADACRVDKDAVTCERLTGPAGSQKWSVYMVSDEAECRLRIVEKRDKKSNRRRVSTYNFGSKGLEKTGGSLPVGLRRLP